MAGPFDALFATWEWEHRNTMRVIAAMPVRRWTWRPHAKSRTAGDLARHLVQAEWYFVAGAMGLEGAGPDPAPKDRPPPPRAALLRTARASHARLLRGVRRGGTRWLRAPVGFHGLRMRRHEALDLMIRHEVHHRAQLGVCVRLGGGKVPSIYGGSADEPAR